MSEHRIITWNVNGLRARADALVRLWDSLHPTVLCLQEIKCSAEQVPDVVRALPDAGVFWNPGPAGYSGTAILYRASAFPAAPPRLTAAPFDSDGRATLLEVGSRTLVNLYMPSGGRSYREKLDFYDALIAWADAQLTAGRALWICGDMNVAHTDRDIHPRQRAEADIGVRPSERDRVDALIALGLPDLYRAADPEMDDHFTWWPYWRGLREKNQGWRLDYHFASAGFAAVRRLRVHTAVTGSDHAPVSADVCV